MWKVVGAAMIAVAAIGMAGCRTAAVYDVVDAPVVGPADGRKLSSEQVRNAIIRAGTGLGWQVREVQPFLLEGTLHLRSHMARVNIPYSTERYSIVYKESDNLQYDGKMIHSNYNGWVQNLDKAIKANLAYP
ncbi:MAG: hypothetical protein KJ025_20675 [Burkholderiales bacterium]|nr:hypothetical protein [Burkholderiales bacterium]